MEINKNQIENKVNVIKHKQFKYYHTENIQGKSINMKFFRGGNSLCNNI